MFTKTLLTTIAIASTLTGASMLSSNAASAFPNGGFHPFPVQFPVHQGFPGGPAHMIPPGALAGAFGNPGHICPLDGHCGPIINPVGNPDHGHHGGWGGPNFGVEIDVGGGYASNYVSCGEARSIVHSSGYSAVQPQDCDGGVYSFTGLRHGVMFDIDINNRGRILNANPV